MEIKIISKENLISKREEILLEIIDVLDKQSKYSMRTRDTLCRLRRKLRDVESKL